MRQGLARGVASAKAGTRARWSRPASAAAARRRHRVPQVPDTRASRSRSSPPVSFAGCSQCAAAAVANRLTTRSTRDPKGAAKNIDGYHLPRAQRPGAMGPSSHDGPSREAVALGPQRRLGAVGDVERAEDPREVGLDGLLADLEPAGDELVRQALDEQREHLALAGGQPAGVGRGPRDEHRARRARVERRLAPRGRADAPATASASTSFSR